MDREYRFELQSAEVAPKGVISGTAEFYRKNNIPMAQLLSDYAAVYLGTGAAVNPWAIRQKEMHLPYERGATIAETAMLTQACKLKACLPTDVIRALFYNKNNNDSGFECGVLQELFAKFGKKGCNAVINPSPDFLLKDFSESVNTYYIVVDPLVAKLYRKQFKTERIIAVDELTKLPEIHSYLIMQRQYPDIGKMLEPLRFRSGPATVVALLPHITIQNENSCFWKKINENNLYIETAIRIDSAVLSTPKKKTIFILSAEPQTAVALWDSKYDSVKKEIKLFGPVRKIDYNRFREGGKSMLELLSTHKGSENKQIRKAPKKYYFSDEIILSYTQKTDSSGSPKITASYYSTSCDKNQKRGKKLIGDMIHRIGKAAAEDILEKIPFENHCAAIIGADVRENYAINQLSLKTAWFLNHIRLEADREYNHDVASRMFFGNNDISQIRLQEATQEDMITAMETVFVCDKDDIEYIYWRQLDLIIRKLIRAGFAGANPIEEFVNARSNRLSEEQREVRNALVKKVLEQEEMRRIIEYLSSDSDGEKNYALNSRYVAGWIKLLTGMSNAEICALQWSDYIPLRYGLGRQLRVAKRMGDKGVVSPYTAKESDKIRNVPVTTELQFVIDRFYQHIRAATKISEADLKDKPIVLSTDALRDGDLKPMSLAEMNRLIKKLLDKAEIGSHKVVLHDGTEQTEIDLHTYKGDFFRLNAYFFFRHVCNMPDGEASYLIGRPRPTTFYRNYLDFSNDFVQYRMAQEMRRGISCYDSLIGLPTKTQSKGTELLTVQREQRIASDGRNIAAAQLLFPNGCHSGDSIKIWAEHGLKWNCSFAEEGTE